MMKRIIYKQSEFSQVEPNEPFYLVHPNTVQLPAIPAVHYPCEIFSDDTPVWIVSDEIVSGRTELGTDYIKGTKWCTVLV
jgi:hypothetical protein